MGIRRTTGGFTLVELLIVLVVIGLLASILAPSFLRAVELARRAICQGNLHVIHQAYTLRKSDEMINAIVTRTKTTPMSPSVLARPINRQAQEGSNVLEAHAWGGALRAYMGDSSKPFLCPSDESPTSGLPDIRMRVWGSGGAEHADYDINLTNIYPYWEHGPANQCTPQPGVWKVASHNPSAFPENRHNMDRLPPYSPGEKPNEYWLLVETARYGADYHAGGDLDYNDIVFKVTVKATELTFEAYQFWAGQTYNLVGPTGTVYGSPSQSVGQATTRGPFSFARVPLSYGMNSQVVDLPVSANRILVLDYEDEVCYTGSDVGGNAGWASLKAGRHLGRCNVLMAGGQIAVFDPPTIDPEASEDNFRRYWTVSR